MKRWTLWAAAVLLMGATLPLRAAEGDFLDPEVAFGLNARLLDARRLELRFDIAPGYYLYRDKFSVEAVSVAAGTAAAVTLELPRGRVKFDETFQKDVEYFREQATMVATLASGAAVPTHLVVAHQGCADKGLCYPPMQRVLRLDPAPGAAGMAVTLLDADASARILAFSVAPATAAPAVAAIAAAAPPDSFDAALQSRSLLQVAGVFLLAGLLLSFTPCVLPMIPILSSIIVGQSGAVSRAKGFSLALAYSLGMALVYTGFGMLAGLMGEGLAAALQNAWVLGAFALLLAALSLSMFGVYELQMPSAVQSRITQWSGQLNGGQHAGVFVMGGLSALIVGPCVAAPLAGALVYISQTRDVVLGGLALFALAAGMSVPLLLVGLSAGSLLPRAGGWMERVKHVFGFMLLAVAVWMVSPVLPVWAVMLMVATLLLSVAVYLGAFERLPETLSTVPLGRVASKGCGLMLGVLATLLLAGAASGGRELLQPLRHVSGGALGLSEAVRADGGLHFESVTSLEALDRVIATSDKPVMLDLYADWCVACKEFEAITLRDPSVRSKLAGLRLLRVDVTDNTPQHKALMRRYALFGPPALLFFPPAGPESKQVRVIGFQAPAQFARNLERFGASL